MGLSNRLVGVLFTVILQASAQAEEKKPFSLDTFEGKTGDFLSAIPLPQEEPDIDTEQLYIKILQCYPSRSRFGDFSLKLTTRAGNRAGVDDGFSDEGNFYIGIVADMPIIDSNEHIERQRKREYDRRTQTAGQVADFVQAVAKRNQAERELGLFSALEQRAKVRVQMGVTSTTEQVKYLTSVISSRHKLTAAKAEVIQARLALSGQCSNSKMPAMNAYLSHLGKPRKTGRNKPKQAIEEGQEHEMD